MRVLIADDDEFTRRVLQRYLEQWGHVVSVAQDGESAWRLFDAEPFPMVLTDWNMPQLDGIALIRRIRASRAAERVYIVLLTARSDKEDVVGGMEAGADDFLAKPFDRDELRVRLREGARIVALEEALADTRRECKRVHSLVQQVSQTAEQDLQRISDFIERLGLGADGSCQAALDQVAGVRELVMQLRSSIPASADNKA